MPQKEREAALGSPGTARQRNGRGKELYEGARSHDGEEVHTVVAEREHEIVRHQVEKRELEHRDDHGEHHRLKMPRRALELFGKREDLVIDERAPFLDLERRETHALQNVYDPMSHTCDGLGHERNGEDAEQNAAMPAEREHAQKRHVAVALRKKRHARQQQDGAPGNEAELVDDKARELRGARLAHVLPRLGKAIDLSRGGTHHHGREIAEEDTARLHGDEVADTDRRLGVEPDGDGIGHDAKEQVHEHAEARSHEPGSLHAAHGAHELRDLTGHDKIDDVDDEDGTDEDRATTSALVVVAARRFNLDLGFSRSMMRRVGHDAPSRCGHSQYIVALRGMLINRDPERRAPIAKQARRPVEVLVARTRFELVISALRGRRPEPLDERAICTMQMAGMEGVEPPLTEPESAVLPLDDIPKMHRCAPTRPSRKKEIYGIFQKCARHFLKNFRSAPAHLSASRRGESCNKKTSLKEARRTFGSPYQIRTGDLRLERAAS